MTAPRRPRRQNKADRLISPGSTPEQIQVDFALAPFDKAAREIEQTWGIDRLPELVSMETAAKFGSAMAKLNAAIAADDPAETAKKAAVCIRGLAAMDAEARAAGHTPPPPVFWQYELDGKTYTFIRDVQDWPAVAKVLPKERLYTLREAALALAASDQAVATIAAVKDEWPGAEIAAVRREASQLEKDLEDEIPF